MKLYDLLTGDEFIYVHILRDGDLIRVWIFAQGDEYASTPENITGIVIRECAEKDINLTTKGKTLVYHNPGADGERDIEYWASNLLESLGLPGMTVITFEL